MGSTREHFTSGCTNLGSQQSALENNGQFWHAGCNVKENQAGLDSMEPLRCGMQNRAEFAYKVMWEYSL